MEQRECLEENDEPFAAATFARKSSRHALSDDDECENLPENLQKSVSKVPGMSPQELLAAHRHSLADASGNPNVDLHSITLSRREVEPEMISAHDTDAFSGDDEYNECLNSFKFGES